MSHKGHPTCEFNSKAACEKARRTAIGQCVSMIEETRQCPHWGVDQVEGRAYCGQHLGSVFRAADEAKRTAATRAAMIERIDAFMVKTGQVPHVCGERCEFSKTPTKSGGTERSESTLPPEVPLF
jgi:hypothetical protein